MSTYRATKVVTALLVAATVAFPAARAQEKFPSKPIELIVPTPPGGGTDITGRLLAEEAERFLGQKVVVVNKPGASGSVGIAHIIQAKPDGYTLAYVWNAPLTIVPHTLNVPYKTEDLTPITQATGGTPLIFCVKPDFPANTAREFVDYLKANPNKYTYGNDGIGATVQLAGERLFGPLGVKLRAVPFGGAGETLKAFLGGHIDIYGGSIPPIIGFVKQGKAKCLLATSDERNDALPNAGSAGDLGLGDNATELWRGVIGPNGLPADRLEILQKAFSQAAQTEKFKAFADKRGEKAIGSSMADFKKKIVAEYSANGVIIANLGLMKK
ncbi:MAG: tripartite tricarboxylate transporter substrate binding protein [Gemmatimonadetes bacterium]|nr:tripartite tricarboxylate transporter substrate binding protein [Gemmatimonadota bacterium]